MGIAKEVKAPAVRKAIARIDKEQLAGRGRGDDVRGRRTAATGRPVDGVTSALVEVVLNPTAISIAGPAWRAARIEPATALRSK